MLAYGCKKCGQIFIFGGYKNEFEEYFCSKECYKKYCENNNYISDFKKLKRIDYIEKFN